MLERGTSMMDITVPRVLIGAGLLAGAALLLAGCSDLDAEDKEGIEWETRLRREGASDWDAAGTSDTAQGWKLLLDPNGLGDSVKVEGRAAADGVLSAKLNFQGEADGDIPDARRDASGRWTGKVDLPGRADFQIDAQEVDGLLVSGKLDVSGAEDPHMTTERTAGGWRYEYKHGWSESTIDSTTEITPRQAIAMTAAIYQRDVYTDEANERAAQAWDD